MTPLAESVTRTPPPLPRRSGPEETARWSQTSETTGELVTPRTTDTDPDWDTIFAHWNLDPEVWEVVPGTLRVNAWEGPIGSGEARIFRQFKATVRRRTNSGPDVEELLAEVRRWKPRRRVAEAPGSAFVVVATDWQIGGEGGTELIVGQLMGALDAIEARAKVAVKAGATTLVIPSLGDMVEGVEGNYPAQLHTVDLDLTSQLRVARRVFLAWLRRLVPYFDRVVVIGIPGNHGRRGATVITSPLDNADLDYLDGVAEVCAETDWGRHIEFYVPRDKLVVTKEVAGTNLLCVHGDQRKGPAQRMIDWWRDASFTRHGDSDCADILLLGHRHHLRVEELAIGRWVFQCPSMDGGSAWFADVGGGTSRPGVLTFATRDGEWWGMEVCAP